MNSENMNDVKTKGIISQKWFLYSTEFFSGMSVMAVELGASRLLAPYFSSSQIVWTIIIGAIMIAMALGNIWGGRIADKNADPVKLYIRLLIAGVWIAAIPFLGKYVIAGVSLVLALFVTKNFLIWASLISCLLVFVFPLMLLGTVTPSLVKYTVKNLNNSGKTVGELGALNTIGSIIGTFLPTFVTIPTVGTSVTFIIFAAILIIISLIYLFSARKKLVKATVCGILSIALSIAGAGSSFAFWEKDLIYEGESVYNYLQVKEDSDRLILSTNVLFGVQSVKTKKPGLTGLYYDTALAAPFMADVMNKEQLNILVLGMGTGTFATMNDYYFDNVNIQGVEIDEKIADMAYTYFELPEEVSTCVYDGRTYLFSGDGKDKKYDLIMVDAYQDITIPFQMSTVEFFTLVKEHLTEDGVMVVNLNMKSDADGSINEYICDTIAYVFDNVYTAEAGGNRELFASSNVDMIKIFADNYGKHNDFELRIYMAYLEENISKYESGDYILTDDKAPVELLGMRVIDGLIETELVSLKEQLKGADIKQLFEMIK